MKRVGGMPIELLLLPGDSSAREQDCVVRAYATEIAQKCWETGEHCVRVANMSVLVGRMYGIKGVELRNFWRGAILHDIGKLAIPDHILQKPGALTRSERKEVERHPLLALDYLEKFQFLNDCTDVPLYHHERWDGLGYPFGRQGENIPLPARIFAVIDVFDALTSDRPYRRAWSTSRSLDHIHSNSGTHFDPEAVRAFSLMVEEIDVFVA